MTRSALYCEHANEVPSVCPCDAGCYCKAHMCGPRERAIEFADALRRDRVAQREREELTRNAQHWLERHREEIVSDIRQVDEAIVLASGVEARCAAAHKDELSLAMWGAALVAVLVCLGQLAAERAPPSRDEWFKNLEVD